MQFDGALVKEQNVTFAIVIVKPNILNNTFECSRARQNFSNVFRGLPIVLMAQDISGIPTYQGRHDIVNFLSHINPSRIPWKTYTLN